MKFLLKRLKFIDFFVILFSFHLNNIFILKILTLFNFLYQNNLFDLIIYQYRKYLLRPEKMGIKDYKFTLYQ